jgi:hypothetical protein
VQGVSGVERPLPRGVHYTGALEEDIGGGEESAPGVLTVIIGPTDELLEPGARMKQAGEVPRVVGLYFIVRAAPEKHRSA